MVEAARQMGASLALYMYAMMIGCWAGACAVIKVYTRASEQCTFLRNHVHDHHDTAMGEHASSGLGPPKMANAASPRSAAAKPEKVKKAGGCGCNKNKDKAADTTESTAGQCLLKNKDEAVTDAADGAAPCPHCGKSEPGSCPKCVGKAATGAEEDVATAPPAQEPFVVTEEMVWQEDEL